MGIRFRNIDPHTPVNIRGVVRSSAIGCGTAVVVALMLWLTLSIEPSIAHVLVGCLAALMVATIYAAVAGSGRRRNVFIVSAAIVGSIAFEFVPALGRDIDVGDWERISNYGTVMSAILVVAVHAALVAAAQGSSAGDP